MGVETTTTTTTTTTTAACDHLAVVIMLAVANNAYNSPREGCEIQSMVATRMVAIVHTDHVLECSKHGPEAMTRRK